ncbi:MAG: [FeFe] hydrogenase H-cluster radical SAM maturase HydE [Ruminococcaceae bacterium]|nr:[FeFe] hydrogenase H-cluster radical SAM maturase HydE [Oscillospiraceae bacterium]
MNAEALSLIDKLSIEHRLSAEEYEFLILNRTADLSKLLAQRACEVRNRIYGNTVFIRGLIEIGNFCKNDCLYCGIRRSNRNCMRYRLTDDEIMDCCHEGYALGFRTFVLQGGEDAQNSDERICALLRRIKAAYPDCAVTLSLGERSYDSYAALRQAGADRYLLRHETAVKSYYEFLHPKEMQFENRVRCLKDLKQLGYQVGCGFMVGAPDQTVRHIASDLVFVQEFQPQMCGIGPFIPHKDTCFAERAAGSAELTCFLLSILRLIKPNILLPATTALGSIASDGRERGILSGANVVMPNLSPSAVRKKYMLYDNKISDGEESAQCIDALKQRMKTIGYEIVTDRGDIKL